MGSHPLSPVKPRGPPPLVPAGWLISSSRGLLNLWEASPSGGRGEPALMCMHSQVGRRWHGPRPLRLLGRSVATGTAMLAIPPLAPSQAFSPGPQPAPPSPPLNPWQGTDYTIVCMDADRSSRMLVGASQDRAGGEWLTCHSLEVESLLVRGVGDRERDRSRAPLGLPSLVGRGMRERGRGKREGGAKALLLRPCSC